ncbi:MAG: efflux RND transporter permease subunit [Candidatus Eiseniibacteriota bacterium]|nr:MAG: efflux RND transporter permease subunit [Candidatus Eisenbacteria bacterium]
MRLSGFSVRRPVAISMFVLVFVVMGFISLRKMPVEFIPELNFPVLFLSGRYEGVGPEEMEELVTRPLEASVSQVSGVKNIRSVSQYGVSALELEFEWGTDLDQTMGDIRENIEIAVENEFLPEDLRKPLIFKYDPADMPVSFYGVSSAVRTQRELKNISEDDIRPVLEKLDGVAYVIVWAGGEREIRVAVDQAKLAALGMSLGNVVNIIRAEDTDLGAGHVVQELRDYNVKIAGEFQSIDDVANLVLKTDGGTIVKLKDIADVSYEDVEKTAFARMDLRESAMIAVMKQSGANTVSVARKVRKALESLGPRLPEDVGVHELFDSAAYIEDSVRNVRDAALYGALLAIFVVWLFLRSYRSSFIIGLAIPISIVCTFFPLYFMGISVNIISLGGLAIGVGMLVDNSIVVLENIFRRLHGGEDRFLAAEAGSAQVAMAVTASTLTTVIVFVPILFTQGIVKVLFGQLAASVAFSLVASLVVALTLVPMICSKIMNVAETRRLDRSTGLMRAIRARYERILLWSLGHRKTVLLSAAGLFVAGLVLLVPVGADFMPQSDDGIFAVFAELPGGAPLEETDRLIYSAEERLLQMPNVATIFAMGGEAAEMTEDMVPNKGTLYVRLVDKEERDVSTREAMDMAREELTRLGGAKYTLVQMGPQQGGGYGDIEIKVSGNDYGTLRMLAKAIESEVATIDGVRETASSIEESRPEVRLVVDRERSALVGMDAWQLATMVKTALQGTVATRIEQYGTEVDVRVQLAESGRDRIERLESMVVSTPQGVRVPLRYLVTTEFGESPAKLHRENQRRLVWIGVNRSGRDLRGLMTDVRGRLSNFPLPEGYTIDYGGEDEDMRESFRNLAIDFLLALILVYMVMAALFESLLHPFTIMLSVPFAITGAIFALFITQHTLTVNALIGVVMLVGIVVNNAIVLLDYVQRLRAQGKEMREALYEAGCVRLRPILLTAMTTVLGLLPLALGLGEGSEVRTPMAVAVIGGLTLSTLLSLVIVPVVYTYVDAFGQRLQRTFLFIFHRGEAR